MNKNTLRTAILVLGLATALIHFSLNFLMGGFDPVFTANGLGYLALLAAFFLPIAFLKGREKIVQYAFMGYTAVTILAWVAIGEKNIATIQGVVGYTAKVIELLLIASLYSYSRSS